MNYCDIIILVDNIDHQTILLDRIDDYKNYEFYVRNKVFCYD